MLRLLLRLWRNIDFKSKIKLLILFILLVINAGIEILSIGSAIPFLTALSSYETIYTNEHLRPIIIFFKIQDPFHAVEIFALIFGITIAAACIFRVLTLYLTTKISFQIGTDISINLYYKTLNRSYSYHIKNNSSRVLNNIIHNSERTLSVIHSLLTISSSLIILSTITVVILYINWKISLITLLSFIFTYAFITIIIKKRLQSNSLIINVESANIIKTLSEGLRGIREVIINNTCDLNIKKYKKHEIPKRKSLALSIIYTNSPKIILEAFGMIVIIMISYYLFTIMKEGQIVYPILGVIALTAQRMLPLIQQLYLGVTTIIANQASLEDALDTLDYKIQRSKDTLIQNKIIFKSCIELKNVSFKYPQCDNFVLENINLRIIKGSHIGIIGPTGSGKSTLLDIIIGLMEPTEGKLLIDGCEINEENINSWMSKISHVPQEIHLIDATFYENIAFGVDKDKIEMTKVVNAAIKANIYDDIKKLNEGLNTIIGERGILLSGGQKQRIAIARALYKECELLVFDEATSALDSKTESLVMDQISNIDGEITTIMIAHRLSSLKYCSAIYKIENNKIINSY